MVAILAGKSMARLKEIPSGEAVLLAGWKWLG
jgi:hypothetical protein